MSNYVKIDEEVLSSLVAKELRWSAKHADSKKIRKACRRASMYFMTYEECIKHYGEKLTQEMWDVE